jgi:hypothetical protein
MMRRAFTSLIAVASLAGLRVDAQTAEQCALNGGRGGGYQRYVNPNPAYDGRVAFVRLWYATGGGGGGFRGGGRDTPWQHDYPRAERNFAQLITELTSVRFNKSESHVLALDDPELFKYPIAYMSEPGRWYPNENEVLSLRKYLLKGGFLIFDDFAGRDILNLQQQMLRVLPDMRLIELDAEHPVFDTFFRVRTLDYYHSYQCIKSVFYGIFEDNDPTKRMLAIVNDNSDLGEAWEWSAEGLFPIQVSNDSYKLGINYFIYALTR